MIQTWHTQEKPATTTVNVIPTQRPTGRGLNILISQVRNAVHSSINCMLANMLLDLIPQLAHPCDSDGAFLPPGSTPCPPPPQEDSDWSPFESEVQFKVADLLYRQVEMSAANVDALMELWTLSLAGSEGTGMAPFTSHSHLHAKIDESHLGDVPWQCLATTPSQAEGVGNSAQVPLWMRTSYQIWYRNPNVVVANMLANVDFAGQFDWRPYVETNAAGARRWNNVLSANLAWRHCVSVHLSFAIVHSHFTEHRTIYMPMTTAQRAACTVPLFLGATRL